MLFSLSSASRNRIRIIYLCLGLLLGILLAWMTLAPRKQVGSDYKYMHCKVCRTELPYEKSFAEEKCLKCKPPKKGTFVPTTHSIGAGSNPYKWFYATVAVEIVVFLGCLVFLCKQRESSVEETFLYCNCPKCKWRLRFRASSVGKQGVCPRCHKLFPFPELAQADTEEFEESESHGTTS